MEVLRFGHSLLGLALVLTGALVVSSLLAIALKERRLVRGARAGFYALFLIVAGSAGCLTYGFVTGQYNVDYIFNYSERHLPFFFKLAGLWAGLDGSLLFWTTILSGFGALVAFQHRWSSRHPTGRRLEPYVYFVLGCVTLFFVYLSWSENPFSVMDMEKRLELAAHFKIDVDEAGNLQDGAGLNMQLVNYWFVIHPPCLYIGFIGFTVPFVFALAALMAGEVGDYWIRIVRRWTMVSWLFLTSGVILGGLWAYRQLGWGGYWAWDPVENASFLPWCTGTAFLHSVMVHERRDMLKGWNAFLILTTFFLTIWGTWMTRSGVVESVHAFVSGSNIGLKFQWFMIGLGVVSLFFLFYRARALRSRNRIDSLLSRDAVFYLNNLVLVVIALAIAVLSFWTKISHDFLGAEVVVGAAQFNLVMTPLFALLLLLTAVGPGLGWVKTSPTALRRNVLIPGLCACGALFLVYVWWYLSDQLGTWREVLVPRADGQHPTAFYPTGLFLGLAFFIVSTVGAEFWRSFRARIKVRKEDPFSAGFNIVVRNNRRWGGYTVHIGIAVLTIGIIASSMFKLEKVMILATGESDTIGPYRVEAVEIKEEGVRPGAPYLRKEVLVRVYQPNKGALPAAHGEASALVAASNETLVSELRPEIRVYPKRDEDIREVSIDRRLLEDIYMIYTPMADGRIQLDVYLNPLMILVYLGWFIMLGGGIFAALPIPGSRVGLAD